MNKRLIKFWIILIGVIGLISVQTIQVQSQTSTSEWGEQVKKATILIQKKSPEENIYPVGSGVIIARNSNEYDVLTVAHNIGEKVDPNNDNSCQYQENKKFTYFVKTFDGESYPIQNIKILGSLDLAVVKFQRQNNKNLGSLELAKLHKLPPDENNLPRDNDIIYVAGFPQSAQPPNSLRIDKGIISYLSSPGDEVCGYKLQYKPSFVNTMDHGASGGGVFNQEGYLIGVHGYKFQDNIINKGVDIGGFWEVAPNELKDRLISSQNPDETVIPSPPQPVSTPNSQEQNPPVSNPNPPEIQYKCSLWNNQAATVFLTNNNGWQPLILWKDCSSKLSNTNCEIVSNKFQESYRKNFKSVTMNRQKNAICATDKDTGVCQLELFTLEKDINIKDVRSGLRQQMKWLNNQSSSIFDPVPLPCY